ncbi:MAG: amino acid racemase [Clostridia bacterium]|nr:amino acid racemase [Clostridia bacterium]
MKTPSSPILGILGGLGPMATVYFYEMIISHTKAERDQDHIDIVINSRATTPDRTAYIMGKSSDNPLRIMVEDSKRLKEYGVTLLAIPCNTAHYFYDMLTDAIDIPFLNIMEETASYLDSKGIKKAGVLATEGTVSSRTYHRYLESHGIECVVPDEENQKIVTDIIYGDIKTGKRVDMEKFMRAAQSLFDKGAEKIILGCTELSLIKKNEGLDARFVDSLEVLAKRAIEACGKETIGFEL